VLSARSADAAIGPWSGRETAITTIAHPDSTRVVVGVDSHGDLHVACALDQLGRRLAIADFATTPTGYGALLEWARTLGEVEVFGVEGCGCYGAGLARFLGAQGQLVLEVNRPDRSARRRRGMSDPVDAEAAARAVLAGQVTAIPKTGSHLVEMVRCLRVARVDAELDHLTAQAAPRLRQLCGVGPEIAGALLVAAGDNPGRLRSEAAFSILCGASPIPASSGKTVRHRLNRGGNRQANTALYRIVVVRLRWHQPTRAYLTRRTKEGLSKREIIRCFKRYVAREVFAALHAPTALADAT
jgi:transposase